MNFLLLIREILLGARELNECVWIRPINYLGISIRLKHNTLLNLASLIGKRCSSRSYWLIFRILVNVRQGMLRGQAKLLQIQSILSIFQNIMRL